jgi:hypothetical protein
MFLDTQKIIDEYRADGGLTWTSPVMGCCKNCKWWDRTYDSVCDLVSYDTDGVGDAESAFHVDVLDDSGLNVLFVTGPEFGCVRFDPKIQEEEDGE